MDSKMGPPNEVPNYGDPVAQSPWPAMVPQNLNLAQTLPSWPSQQNQASFMQLAQNMGGFNNMAFVPTQLLQDAIRMSAPVGSSPNDDALLAQALHDSTKNGHTYKQAMDSLHGINNHGSSLWKDYYLDHKPRIDQLVANLANPVVKTAKKPQPSPSPPPRASSYEKRRVALRLPSRRASANDATITSSSTSYGNRRRTINSITTPAPVFHSSLPPPHAAIQIPPPPSRSPTPPTEVVPGRKGNRYTEADKTYFVRFISWRLKQDPSLTKGELCEMLSQKAPHHSQGSWTSFWHGRHDLADKILAAAKVEESSGGDHPSDFDPSSDCDDLTRNRGRSRKIALVPTDDSESDSSTPEEDSTSDDSVDSNEDEQQMGENGSKLTKADMRFMAKHIVASDVWENTRDIDRWTPFCERFPQRTVSSWIRHYQRCQKKIHRLAQKYEKQREGSNPLYLQRARPSWLASNGSQLDKKRKPLRDEDGDYMQPKRARSDPESDKEGDSYDSD